MAIVFQIVHLQQNRIQNNGEIRLCLFDFCDENRFYVFLEPNFDPAVKVIEKVSLEICNCLQYSSNGTSISEAIDLCTIYQNVKNRHKN